MSQFLDVRTIPCPGPVMELRKLLDAGGRDVRLHVGDDIARSNVTRFASSRGAQVRSEAHSEGGFLVFVTVPGEVDVSQPSSSGDPQPACGVPPSASSTGPRVVQLTSRTMGTGDDELGALLLRGFVKTLANVEPRPQIVVCYNGAVGLCCEGSPLLDDLRVLQAAGVSILACGTCLNFFGLAGKLVVGRVTDMLEIVTTLTRASHVIRP